MDAKNAKRLQVVGRVALAVLFLVSGVGKLTAWKMTAGYAAAKGVPAFALAGATLLELAGAISLITGYKVRWGALVLLVFLVPVTLVMHAFWTVQGPQQQLEVANFLKNVSIAGGLLVLYAAQPATQAAVEERAAAA
jgi:putative oxidoreductase